LDERPISEPSEPTVAYSPSPSPDTPVIATELPQDVVVLGGGGGVGEQTRGEDKAPPALEQNLDAIEQPIPPDTTEQEAEVKTPRAIDRKATATAKPEERETGHKAPDIKKTHPDVQVEQTRTLDMTTGGSGHDQPPPIDPVESLGEDDANPRLEIRNRCIK
ncbi:MAG TPA: hypothetical protein VGS08_01540, partial [Candidatus Saccharimonadales bacterium]|nr:hypothetical protein [Candidatus Saccharimonadales bacterium]